MEIRVNAAFAHLLFRPDEGTDLGSVRLIRISTSDPRYRSIGEIQNELNERNGYSARAGKSLEQCTVTRMPARSVEAEAGRLVYYWQLVLSMPVNHNKTMMKFLYFLILIFAITSCVVDKRNSRSSKKWEIIRTDTIRDHYVFKTRDKLNNELIILAEKDKVSGCEPFKPFITADSIHEVTSIKSGSRVDFIGSTLSIIDGVTIKKRDELAKIISNCNCFTDN